MDFFGYKVQLCQVYDTALFVSNKKWSKIQISPSKQPSGHVNNGICAEGYMYANQKQPHHVISQLNDEKFTVYEISHGKKKQWWPTVCRQIAAEL